MKTVFKLHFESKTSVSHHPLQLGFVSGGTTALRDERRKEREKGTKRRLVTSATVTKMAVSKKTEYVQRIKLTLQAGFAYLLN